MPNLEHHRTLLSFYDLIHNLDFVSNEPTRERLVGLIG